MWWVSTLSDEYLTMVEKKNQKQDKTKNKYLQIHLTSLPHLLKAGISEKRTLIMISAVFAGITYIVLFKKLPFLLFFYTFLAIQVPPPSQNHWI